MLRLIHSFIRSFMYIMYICAFRKGLIQQWQQIIVFVLKVQPLGNLRDDVLKLQPCLKSVDICLYAYMYLRYNLHTIQFHILKLYGSFFWYSHKTENSQAIFITSERNSILISSHCHSCSPQPLADITLLSVSLLLSTSYVQGRIGNMIIRKFSQRTWSQMNKP